MQAQHHRQVWLGILISTLCLIAVFYFVRPTALWQALQMARYEWLIVAAVNLSLFLFLRAIRWQFLLNGDVSWKTVFHIQNIGYFATNILPLRLGDIIRAVLIGTVPPLSPARGLSTMVVERVLDLLFVVTLLPFIVAEVETLPDWMQATARLSGGLAIGAIVILILAANQRQLAIRMATAVLQRLPRLKKDIWLMRLDELLAGLDRLRRLRQGSLLLMLSILVWIPVLLSYYVGLLAVNLQPSWSMAAFVFCASAFSMAIPASPGQIGVFHVGVITALQIWGQPEDVSASFAFLYHALIMLVAVFWGSIGIYTTGATFKKIWSDIQQYLENP